MNKNRVVVWFRNDLRMHDNASLFYASQKFEEVIPVYCFDERQFGQVRLGLPKTGVHRVKFLIESVNDLKNSLSEVGSDLLVLFGNPEELVVSLAEKLQASAIFFSEEIADEEKSVEHLLEQRAWAKGIRTEAFWQSTLFHLQDLPFPVSQTPEVFTQFRKECEKFSKVQKVFPKPKSLPIPQLPEEYNVDKAIDLEFLGLKEPDTSSNGVLRFKGGESAAVGRLQTYFWEQDLLKVYKETRNGLLGADYSSKFSPWLALGCISPRFIYWEILRYEKERKKNQSTYWLIFELIWRDYFRFVCKKHGSKVFQLKGLKSVEEKWSRNESMFWRWAEGQTGIPFVDANMRELNQTGFMSNRGRQNVASFLVNDLGIDWRWGASYFESTLIDYDVCSNWGNWMYVAGVGNDPRENRYFNILKQAQNYDKKGDYIRHWIPEISGIHGFDIHQPHTLSPSELKRSGVSLGGNYPHPVVKIRSLSY